MIQQQEFQKFEKGETSSPCDLLTTSLDGGESLREGGGESSCPHFFSEQTQRMKMNPIILKILEACVQATPDTLQTIYNVLLESEEENMMFTVEELVIKLGVSRRTIYRNCTADGVKGNAKAYILWKARRDVHRRLTPEEKNVMKIALLLRPDWTEKQLNDWIQS